jgi:hypothetical protein
VRDLLVYHKHELPGRALQETLPRAKWAFGAPEALRWFVTDDNFWPSTCIVDGPLREDRSGSRKLLLELERIRKAGPPRWMALSGTRR